LIRGLRKRFEQGSAAGPDQRDIELESPLAFGSLAAHQCRWEGVQRRKALTGTGTLLDAAARAAARARAVAVRGLGPTRAAIRAVARAV
jgi:hypothetical protein